MSARLLPTDFDLQDDLVPRIVSTVADQYGVLPRGMSEVLRSQSEDTLTPHEAVLEPSATSAALVPRNMPSCDVFWSARFAKLRTMPTHGLCCP